MQLNAAVDTKPNTPLEYPTNSVQEFHFLNLEVEKGISNNNNHGVWTPDEEIAELLEAGENGDSILNEGTGNPDEDTKRSYLKTPTRLLLMIIVSTMSGTTTSSLPTISYIRDTSTRTGSYSIQVPILTSSVTFS